MFAAYNGALWPFAAALWLITAAAFAWFVAGGPQATNVVRMLLAGHWLWAGVMYHAFFFTAMNPAAWVFAALFVVQAGLLAGWRVSPLANAARPGSTRHVMATALIAYGIAYTLVVWAEGFVYPRMPTFGVHADVALPAAGALLACDLILKRSHVMKKVSFASLLAVVVMMLAGLPPIAALAQAPEKSGAKMEQMKMDQMKMGDMKMMEEMAAKQKANTERINVLMATVKSAKGETRVAAMADVISVLLEERTAMQEHCAAMMKMMHK